ncbi:MAG: hypothetical protein U0U09_02035 [Cyclobacteriaceae bacterium]
MDILVKFGRWDINPKFGIIGRINRGYDYNIAKDRLWETIEYKGQIVWSWLIHLAKKTWTTPNNFNDLVAAFFFAQDVFKKDMPKNLHNVSAAQSIYIAQQLVAIGESEETESEDGGAISVESMKKYLEKLENIKTLTLE